MELTGKVVITTLYTSKFVTAHIIHVSISRKGTTIVSAQTQGTYPSPLLCPEGAQKCVALFQASLHYKLLIQVCLGKHLTDGTLQEY